MEEPTIEEVSYDWFGEAMQDLLAMIEEDDYEPDYVVSISRGGNPIGTHAANYFGGQDGVPLGTIYIQTYDGREKLDEVVLQDTMLMEEVEGRVLLVDDLVDSGDTLAFAERYLKERGIDEVRTAVLHRKERSRTEPDYFVETAPDRVWMEYPWERS